MAPVSLCVLLIEPSSATHIMENKPLASVTCGCLHAEQLSHKVSGWPKISKDLSHRVG